MGIRFSESGPDFPSELVDQLLAGEVVFLCGAGVSAPQLPGFRELVEEVYLRIGLEPDTGENTAIHDGRYEEALGALTRRLAHPAQMYRVVESLLAVPVDPDLSRHATLLRLSRDLNNRVSLVTTNFDPLFERALAQEEGVATARRLSVAGQSLPAPGAEDFGGIIHLHGRHPDSHLGIEGTSLVLISAEYGDAYMRSGWASRFLFDLARCKTLVLVGYSATDAPVRYFLNVLEADRERFSDLRTVYSFDAVEQADAEADARWSTLAVHPITYRRIVAGLAPHEILWQDLEALSRLVERPKAHRRTQAIAILGTRLADATPANLDAIGWLIRDGDLWDVVIAETTDPAWFDYFNEGGLWSPSDAVWVSASWCSRAWRERTRLRAAIAWGRRYGRDFAAALALRLGAEGAPDGIWLKAWRLLT